MAPNVVINVRTKFTKTIVSRGQMWLEKNAFRISFYQE